MRQCTNCGSPRYSGGSLYCTRCGARSLGPVDWLAIEFKHLDNLVVGLILAVSGLALYLWMRAHSPHMGLGEMIGDLVTDPDAYYIREPIYSGLVLLSAVSGLVGFVLIARGLIRETRG